jgi:hypothetical protein|tara:strand:+ start:1045 stop:1473 length:429 start_codon:yes stop_codon:yes gene_type:complete
MQERDNARMTSRGVFNSVVDGSMSVIHKDVDTKFVKHLQEVTQKVLSGEISKEKAVRMVVSETYIQRIDSCYICHKDIEKNEKRVGKHLDPVTDQLPTITDTMDEASYIPKRFRHAYHESYTQEALGYSEVEEKRQRDAFRS